MINLHVEYELRKPASDPWLKFSETRPYALICTRFEVRSLSVLMANSWQAIVQYIHSRPVHGPCYTIQLLGQPPRSLEAPDTPESPPLLC